MFFNAKGLSLVSFEIYMGGEIPLIVSYLSSILNKETSKILLLLLALCISSQLFKKQYRQIVDRGKCLLQYYEPIFLLLLYTFIFPTQLPFSRDWPRSFTEKQDFELLNLAYSAL